MMRAVLTALLALCVAGHAAAAPADPAHLLALCYHDVVETEAQALADPSAVTVDTLVRQLAWLDAEGYQPISLATWEAARHGGTLPAKPVLLSFDDGYASFHEHVLPLLELFDFPAVLAVVTGWIEAPAHSLVGYGGASVPRDRFMTWPQIRHARDSGLVEVISHSHDLHRGVPGNPYGNLQPAAVTRQFDAAAGGYEAEPDYRRRVRDDLARSAALLERHLGEPPRAVAWPYGAHNAAAAEAARGLGMDYSLTLDPTPNTPELDTIHRRLVGGDMTLEDFVRTVRRLHRPQPLRAAHVDLDYLYDPDPAQQKRNLDRLLDRIKAMAINGVFLQAFADPDSDGVADAVYFPNRHLPMRADLFNRVAWQLRTRANVQVFAWMPVLAFRLPDAELGRRLAVQAADGSHRERYHRLSPFHPQARNIITEIYTDLGRTSHFAGVLFHDDAMLDQREDVSPAALEFYADRWPELAAARPWQGAQREEHDAFGRAKTMHLIAFTDDLAEVLRDHHPALITARNLYARPVLEPRSERWFAQHLGSFLAHYDYTAVMAMPYMERARAPRSWLDSLVARIAARPDGLARTVFEVQTRDWRTGAHLSNADLKSQLVTLLNAGARHIAWYPDDFIAGHPEVRLIRATVSLADHPAMAE